MTDPEGPPVAAPPLSRRRALGRLAGGATACVGAALAVPPAAMFLTPLFRHDEAGARWLVLGPPDRFAVGAAPRRVVLRGRVQDAWMRDDHARVGAVLVERLGERTFRVFSAVCPHLGCTVRFDQDAGHFFCPCHGASYARDGARRVASDGPANPAPRDLDPLDWRLDGGDLVVRWARFATNTPERRELG